MAKGAYIGAANFTKRNLPTGYTQVEYIQSSGTQYIDTGFYANQNSSVSVKFSTTQQSNGGVVVAMQGWKNRGFGVFVNALLFGSSSKDSTGLFGDGQIHEVQLNSEAKCYDNGQLIWTGTVSTFTTPTTLTICKSNVVSEAHEYSSAKVYSCQIYDNGTLVRDFVPCKNSGGTVGLYDMVNAKFYTNAGSGTFTAGSAYGGVARKIKKGYIGISGVARKIKKAYIGIGGVARPCWSGGELAYYGQITSLSAARYMLGATTVGNYALFAGGYKNEYDNDAGGFVSTHFNTVDAYNDSLTRSKPTALGDARYAVGATSIGNYALFGGGQTQYGVTAYVDAYNTSLSKVGVYGLGGGSNPRRELAAATVGDYALFAGGYDGDTPQTVVDYYSSSLTRGMCSAGLNGVYAYQMAATTVGNYALFAGGMTYSGNVISNICAYNQSLTYSDAGYLSVAKYAVGAATVGEYALFAGGSNGSGEVDVVNSSLTMSTATSLNGRRTIKAATTLGDYALFGGGSGAVYTNSRYTVATVDVYDASLTKSTTTDLAIDASSNAATTVGNYALFGGGQGDRGATAQSIVTAYTIK